MKNLNTTSTFSLIETMLWENGNYFLLDLHMKRMGNSVNFFKSSILSTPLFSYSKESITKSLKRTAETFDRFKKYRVRLLLETNGKWNIESNMLDPALPSPVKICISSHKTDKNDIFLRHKTTNRKLYDEELSFCRKNGFFDIMFMNQDNKITEGAISNIIIQKGEEYFTPPLFCGLLNGVYREYLFKEGQLPLKEKTLYYEDLVSADKVFITNSVRKLLPATIVFPQSCL